MKHLRTILKWALPSVKAIYNMLAVSAEVFCRHAFGPRYAPSLLAGFFFCFVILECLRSCFPNPSSPVIDDYLTIYFILILWHLFRMWKPRTPIHSYNNGYSWEFWERLNFTPALVKIIFEPAVFEIVALMIQRTNVLLSGWLASAGLCLFIKEFLSFWRNWNRVHDAVDARLEGERISTGVRQITSPQAGGEQIARPAVAVEQAQQPGNSIGQIYSRLDPALQQLITTPAQNRPDTPAQHRPANRPGAARIVVRPGGTLSNRNRRQT